jgi:hypothetical protein
VLKFVSRSAKDFEFIAGGWCGLQASLAALARLRLVGLIARDALFWDPHFHSLPTPHYLVILSTSGLHIVNCNYS